MQAGPTHPTCSVRIYIHLLLCCKIMQSFTAEQQLHDEWPGMLHALQKTLHYMVPITMCRAPG